MSERNALIDTGWLPPDVAQRLQARVAELEAEADSLADLLETYWRRVPLGHQPHMTAHLVEKVLVARQQCTADRRRKALVERNRGAVA